MDGGGLKPEAVISLLDSSDPVLKETAWWIAGHRPEWGSALAGFFQERLTATNLTSDRARRFAAEARPVRARTRRSRISWRPRPTGRRRDRLVALRAMARTRAKELPSSWIAPLVRALAGRELEVTRSAVSVARAAPPSKDAAADLHAALLRVARDSASPLDVRIDALAAVPGGLTSVDQGLFDLLRSGLEPAQPISIRVAAAAVLEKAHLERKQLLDSDGTARRTPARWSFRGSCPPSIAGATKRWGSRCLRRFKGRRAAPAFEPDILRPRLAKYPESVQQKGEALLASLNVDAARQKQRLEELLAAGKDGKRAMSGADRPCSTARRRPVCRAIRLGIWVARSAPI